jgi:hypothetical protein
MTSGAVLAVDPGRAKCGIAVLGPDTQIIYLDIVPAAMIGETVSVVADAHNIARILLGAGTCSESVLEEILRFSRPADVIRVPEANTTILARKLYWQYNPPGCLMSLIPTGMRIPPRPVDDYAAVAIAQRFLSTPAQVP